SAQGMRTAVLAAASASTLLQRRLSASGSSLAASASEPASSIFGAVESTRMQWHEGITRPVALAELGQRYRRYRLADPEAEDAMAGSLRRWGQLAPVVACVR